MVWGCDKFHLCKKCSQSWLPRRFLKCYQCIRLRLIEKRHSTFMIDAKLTNFLFDPDVMMIKHNVYSGNVDLVDLSKLVDS